MEILLMLLCVLLFCQQHKSMQQIAILIIAISTYVQGIRYDGGNQNNNNNDNLMQQQQQQDQAELINKSNNNFQPLYNAPLPYQQETQQQQQTNYVQMQFYGAESFATTITPLIKTTNKGNNLINVIDDMQSSDNNGGVARQSFRPSQVIDFTLNDATTQQQQQPDNNVLSYASADNNLLRQQFKFPTNLQEQQQQQHREREQYETTASNSVYYNYNNNNNNNNNNLKTNLGVGVVGGGVTRMIPVQLQSTPILSYKDPYTNENYQYATMNGGNGISHEPPSSEVLNLIQQYQPEQQQEEYIVGSSYYVGHNDNDHVPNRGSVDFIYQKQTKQQQQKQQSNKHNHQNQNHYRPQQAAYSSGVPSLQVLPSTPHTVLGERLSYDSHDYPPPSYAQTQTNLDGVVFSGGAIQAPHNKLSSGLQAPASMSNYANNFGNYLVTAVQPDYTIPTYQNTPGYGSPSPSLLSASSSSRPPSSYESFNHNNNNNNKYYENDNNYNKYTFSPQTTSPITYQQQQHQFKQQEYFRPPYYGNGPPPRPVIPAPPPAHGFPSLASFFSTTQEYAPQFTNLLLNGIGGGGGGGQNPSKSPQIRPLRNMQLIKALENIARNDDLQCVPKVLCQMIAAQTQRGQLPAFITSPTITNFLSGFPVTSPMLIYGRAALLGLSGGDNGCIRSYLKCPKNEYEILYYLNNHRGGFFKFFSEPDDAAILQQQPQQQQHNNNHNNEIGGGGESSSLFSIFSAITGLDAFNPTTTTTTSRPAPPPPTPRPATASLDSVGNFFTKILSEYLNGVEYQRRRRKRSPIANENSVKDMEPEIKESNIKQEINLNVEQAEQNEVKEEQEEEEEEEMKNEHDTESRILHKNLHAYDEQTFFPQDKPSHDYTKLRKYQGNRYGRLLKTKAHSQKNSKKLSEIFKKFNANRAQSKLKFPNEDTKEDETSKREVSAEYEEDEQEGDDMNNEKQVVFLNEYESEAEIVPQQHQNEGFVNFLEDEIVRVPNGQKIVFNDNSEDDDGNSYYNGDQQPHDTQINAYKLKEREHRNFVFPDQQYDQYHIRKGRILNRPTYASQYNEYREDTNQNEFVLPLHKRRKQANRAILSSNANSLHINQMSNSAYQNLHFSNTQNTVNSNSNFYANSYAATPTHFVTNRPTTNKYYSSSGSPSSNSNINYNRYGQQQLTAQLTTKPPTRHKDDENIYVTNARGETEYYLTPGGRKVYLHNN